MNRRTSPRYIRIVRHRLTDQQVIDAHFQALRRARHRTWIENPINMERVFYAALFLLSFLLGCLVTYIFSPPV